MSRKRAGGAKEWHPSQLQGVKERKGWVVLQVPKRDQGAETGLIEKRAKKKIRIVIFGVSQPKRKNTKKAVLH